jgi:hypothetical protein
MKINKLISTILVFLFLINIALAITTYEETSTVSRIVGESPTEMLRQMQRDSLDINHVTFYGHNYEQNFNDKELILNEQFPNNKHIKSTQWNVKDFEERIKDFEKNELFIIETSGDADPLHAKAQPNQLFQPELYPKDLRSWQLPIETNNPLTIWDSPYAGSYLPKEDTFVSRLVRDTTIIAPTSFSSPQYTRSFICHLWDQKTIGQVFKESRNFHYNGGSTSRSSNLIGLVLQSYALYGNPRQIINMDWKKSDLEQIEDYCSNFLENLAPNIDFLEQIGNYSKFRKHLVFEIPSYTIDKKENFSIINAENTFQNLEFGELVLPIAVRTTHFPTNTLITNYSLDNVWDYEDINSNGIPSYELDFINRTCYEENKSYDVDFENAYTENSLDFIARINPVEIINCTEGKFRLYKKFNYSVDYIALSPVLIKDIRAPISIPAGSIVNVSIEMLQLTGNASEGSLAIFDQNNYKLWEDETTTNITDYHASFIAPNEEGLHTYNVEFLQDNQTLNFDKFFLFATILEPIVDIPVSLNSTPTINVNFFSYLKENFELSAKYYLINNDKIVEEEDFTKTINFGNNLHSLPFTGLSREAQSYTLTLEFKYLEHDKSLSYLLTTNNPPIIYTETKSSYFEGEEVVIPFNAVDYDQDTLTYAIEEDLPSNFEFDEEIGLFEWTPTFDDSGTYELTFITTDGILSDEETTKITINHVNRVPVLVEINDITANEGDQVILIVSATDPDEDKLTYTINDSRFAQNNNSFMWQTDYEDSGKYDIKIIISDGIEEISSEVEIKVIDTMECGEGQTQLCEKQTGACENSVELCSEGNWTGCIEADYGDYYEPIEVSCDNIDNNCDGTIDENLSQSTNEVGACSINTETCIEGAYIQNNEYSPVDETCNNIDDNCNNLVDEELTNETTCGFDGIQNLACTGGEWLTIGECIDNGVCSPNEQQQRSCGYSDVGSCKLGEQNRTCNLDYQWGEWDICTGNINPSQEVCDSLDNDCDGYIDENSCNSNICLELLDVTSLSFGTICGAKDYNNSADVNKDGIVNINDLTLIDKNFNNNSWCEEKLYKPENVCTNSGECNENDTRLCENQKGVCAESIEICKDGSWPGCGEDNYLMNDINYELVELSCDSLDNDCDGYIDENSCNSNICLELLDVTSLSFGTICGAKDYNNSADVNKDGIVNINDLTLIDKNFNNNSWCEEKLYKPENVCTNSGECNENDTRLCENQKGVCAESIEICKDGSWPGCGEDNYLMNDINYELVELSCDSLDNDCDGKVDEINRSDSCGSCGKQISICTDGKWSKFGQCKDEGVCTPGEFEESSCSNQSVKSRQCTVQCVWSNWGQCHILGECDPGSTEKKECGNSDIGACEFGEQSRTCQDKFYWGEWGECIGNIEPSDEICDGIDNNCNNELDEYCSDPNWISINGEWKYNEDTIIPMSNGYGGHALVAESNETFTDTVVKTMISMENGVREVGICARMSHKGKGYCLGNAWGQVPHITLISYDGYPYNPILLKKGELIGINGAEAFYLKLKTEGESLKGKIWTENQDEPDWQIEATNDKFKEGHIGYYSYYTSAKFWNYSTDDRVYGKYDWCTDLDGDGQFPLECGGLDCNDNDANIYDSALEVCNAIDDDCDGEIDEICDLTGWEVLNGEWASENNFMRNVEKGVGGHSIILKTDKKMINGTITGSVVLHGGNRAGICGRTESEGGGYCLGLSRYYPLVILSSFGEVPFDISNHGHKSIEKFDYGDKMWLKLLIEGKNLKGKTWKDGQVEPGWMIEKTKNIYNSDGYAGFYTLSSDASLGDLSYEKN